MVKTRFNKIQAVQQDTCHHTHTRIDHFSGPDWVTYCVVTRVTHKHINRTHIHMHARSYKIAHLTHKQITVLYRFSFSLSVWFTVR